MEDSKATIRITGTMYGHQEVGPSLTNRHSFPFQHSNASHLYIHP